MANVGQQNTRTALSKLQLFYEALPDTPLTPLTTPCSECPRSPAGVFTCGVFTRLCTLETGPGLTISASITGHRAWQLGSAPWTSDNWPTNTFIESNRRVTVIQINKDGDFRPRQRAAVRQPSWGLFGFWVGGPAGTPSAPTERKGERYRWTGLVDSGTGPGQLPPQTSATLATSSGLWGGGLATHLHSSLCVPMISCWPCGRPWGRRLCPTLQMRKWRLTEINAPTWVVILPGLGQAPWWAQGSNGQVECGQGDPFTLSSRALKTPLILCSHLINSGQLVD